MVVIPLNSNITTMKRFVPLALLFVVASTLLSSCELVQGIFEAGVWVGVISVFVVVAVIIWIIAKLSGGKK